MKLKLAMVALMITISTSSFAQFFAANPSVTILPGVVTAQVFNPYYEPIICNGQVFGQTFRGPVFNAFFVEQILPAGAYRHATVVTNGFNPFVGGWANIHCRFARGW